MKPMNPDPSFERDLQETLADLAAEPAPERLLDRVAAIPHQERRGMAWGWFRFSAGIGVAAAIAILAVAVALPALTRGPSIGPSGPSSASPATSPSAPAPTSPPVSPATVSPAPSATSTPPGVGGPIGGPVPAGFQAASATFISAAEGWVLGTAPCATPPCTSILRTVDGGRTWVGIPAPRVELASTDSTNAPSVSRLRFADPMDGWAFGSSLWATHDGGASWHEIHLSALATGDSIWALETADTLVHAVLFDGQTQNVAIFSSIVGRDDWQASPTRLQIGAGPVPGAELVLHGQSGWLVENDRTVIGGAKLDSETWKPWAPPCLDVNGPAVLAASSVTNLVAICDVGEWATPLGEHLYLSTDGGLSFKEQAVKVPVQFVGEVGASESAIVASGNAGGGSALVATFDGGKSWTQVSRLGSTASVVDLGFTSDSQGIAVVTGQATRGELIMTRDGGHTWTAVNFEAK